MYAVRYVTAEDRAFWFSLDNHLSTTEFDRKVRDRQGYVLYCGTRPIGILRYNLFWDSIPFLNLIFIEEEHRRQGGGR